MIAVVSSTRPDRRGIVVFAEIRPDGSEVQHPMRPPQHDDHVWTLTLYRELPVGRRYGFRVSGDPDPATATSYDPSLLLPDPYARSFSANPLDSRRPWSIVAPEPTMSGRRRRPRRLPWSETVIYETQVRSLTMQNAELPGELRGTYAGLAREEVLTHLKGLGVTAIELLPIHQHVTEPHLIARGLRNLWGYSTLGFFAPDYRFSSTGDRDRIQELCTMVDRIHERGLEVILDVVYNHTAEGGRDQPTLCFRGLADDLYYRRKPENRTDYDDLSGCGNTLDFASPWVRQLVIDSVVYWYEMIKVDGFRFDLGAVLLRGGDDGLDPTFLAELQSAVPKAKMIIEPWDAKGNRVGLCPEPWVQWSDRFREATRRFWLQDAEAADLLRPLAGLKDLVGSDRSSHDAAFVNYVTAHDGRTLNDVVSYAGWHNEDNQEDDGNRLVGEIATNEGVEGPTRDEQVRRRRRDDTAAMLATTVMSRGVPMLLGGDELLRTQHGNNNAYCQDNDISWYDWSSRPDGWIELLRTMIAFRRGHPSLVNAWMDHSSVWAQAVEGPGAFLGVRARCDSCHDHQLAAITINSSRSVVCAAVSTERPADWRSAWWSCADPPEPSDIPSELIAPPRSVVGWIGAERLRG